jgi:hypothetical protein
MRKVLLAALWGFVFSSVAMAQNLPLFTGPQDPALLQFYLNTLIQEINASNANTQLVQVSPLTGATQTLTGTNNVALNLTPAGTIAADTVVFPAAPANGQEVSIFSSQIVSTLTLTVTPASIVGGVTTLAANASVGYRYQASNTTWYRNR